MRFWQKTAYFAAFVLAATLFSTAAEGAAGPTVRIGSATGDSGQEATARLEVLDVPDPGLGAFTIDVAYDKDVVQAVSCAGDPADSLDNAVCNTEYKADSVRVAGFRMTSGLTGDVALADVAFRLTGGEGECSDLTVSIVELTNPSATAFSSPRTENGSICVGDGGGNPDDSISSTPSARLTTPPSATLKPGSTGRPPAFAETNGTQQPEGTAAPGETGSALEDGGTPSSSSTASSSTTQGSQEEGSPAEATRAAATQSAKKQAQAAEDGSDGGSSAWIIAIVVIVAAVALAGTGAMVWKRRSARRL